MTMKLPLRFSILLLAWSSVHSIPTHTSQLVAESETSQSPSIRTSFKEWDDFSKAHRSPGKHLRNKSPQLQKGEQPSFLQGEPTLDDHVAKHDTEKAEPKSVRRFNPGPMSSIRIDFTSRLGEGGFGSVYEGCGPSGEKVAVKEIEYGHRSRVYDVDRESILESIDREFRICSTVDHLNLLQCSPDYEVDDVGEAAFIAFEYCDAGDLFTMLQVRPMDTEEKQCGFYQIMQGIHHLHQNSIIHADIKPDNIFAQSNGILKIGDYGLSRRFPFGRKISGLRGTLEYQAPEMHIAKFNRGLRMKESDFPTRYDPYAADIWAAGMTYLAFRFVNLPWERAESLDLNYRAFVQNPREYLMFFGDSLSRTAEDRLSPEELDFILLMLESNPSKRITASQVMQNRWYQSLFQKCSNEVQSLLI